AGKHHPVDPGRGELVVQRLDLRDQRARDAGAVQPAEAHRRLRGRVGTPQGRVLADERCGQSVAGGVVEDPVTRLCQQVAGDGNGDAAGAARPWTTAHALSPDVDTSPANRVSSDWIDSISSFQE